MANTRAQHSRDLQYCATEYKTSLAREKGLFDEETAALIEDKSNTEHNFEFLLAEANSEEKYNQGQIQHLENSLKQATAQYNDNRHRIRDLENALRNTTADHDQDNQRIIQTERKLKQATERRQLYATRIRRLIRHIIDVRKTLSSLEHELNNTNNRLADERRQP